MTYEWKQFKKADKWMLENYGKMAGDYKEKTVERFKKNIIDPLQKRWELMKKEGE